MDRYEFLVTPLQRTVQVYDTEAGESMEKRTRYCTDFLITDLALKECRIHFVRGKLSDEMHRLLFYIVRGMGYEQVQLEVPEGTSATRLGKKVKTNDGLDRYIVDLTQEI